MAGPMTFLMLSMALLTPLPMYLQRPSCKSATALLGMCTHFTVSFSTALMKCGICVCRVLRIYCKLGHRTRPVVVQNGF